MINFINFPKMIFLAIAYYFLVTRDETDKKLDIIHKDIMVHIDIGFPDKLIKVSAALMRAHLGAILPAILD